MSEQPNNQNYPQNLQGYPPTPPTPPASPQYAHQQQFAQQPPAEPVEQNNTRVIINEKQGASLPAVAATLAIIVNIVVLLLTLVMGVFWINGSAGGFFGFIFFGFVFITLCTSFIIQSPGEATVLEFFGQYKGTVRRTGFSLVLPFMKKKKVLVRTENFETPVSKVNDGDGNPINISAIVVWQLKDTAKATYAVENYQAYLQTQAEAAVRHVASEYPYDYNGIEVRPSLLKDANVVNANLADEVSVRAEAAGIDIIEVRINNLSYSVEIAQAMLQRQQAQAVLDARGIIVKGAVGIVEEAIVELSKDVQFTPEKRASLTADLLVVLVSESKVTPVLEVGKK